VGSQQYYSNEIIAEIYAQVLETAGYTVTREYQIGQREIYLPQIESGDISVIPEYGGNLLQYYAKDPEATDAGSVREELFTVLPRDLTILGSAEATDQDSYTVTRATADAYGLTSIADLAELGGTVTIAANSELATRPYGPSGLMSVYGVDATIDPVEDTGGPLTVNALTDGTVNVANIPTSSPAITDNDLVVLEDPKNLILPENVTPLVRKSLPVGATQAIDGRDWSGWFAWIGAESLATRRAKGVLKREHGLGKAALHAQAYWMRGRALGKSRLLDELNAAHEAE